MKRNVLYGQSGGVTSVINASAYGVIAAAKESEKIGKIFAAKNGIEGVLGEELFDMTQETADEIEKIAYTPGAIFGSCRLIIKSEDQFERIFKTFDAHDIGYFFYNGGNDSMDTVHKIAQKAVKIGYPLKAVGIPKTVDNDLNMTDHCPGYGSAAKYTACAILEASRDLQSMYTSSTKVFLFESMGRDSGWLAASAALATLNGEQIPLLILCPEKPFSELKFLTAIEEKLNAFGYCSIVVSEGIKDEKGEFISAVPIKDSFGNVRLGKVSAHIESLIKKQFKFNVHVCHPDYLQRSSRHFSSFIDWNEAIRAGAMGVFSALTKDASDCMVCIIRDIDKPYTSHYELADLKNIAAQTRFMPTDFLTDEGFYVTEKFFDYATPLIFGEAPNLFLKGIPYYAKLKKQLVEKRVSSN